MPPWQRAAALAPDAKKWAPNGGYRKRSRAGFGMLMEAPEPTPDGPAISRFYLPSSGTAPNEAAPYGLGTAWTDTSSASRLPLAPAKTLTADEILDVASGGAGRTVLYRQWVSPPLARQSIVNQTQKGQILAHKVNNVSVQIVLSVAFYNDTGTLLQTVTSQQFASGIVNGGFTNAVMPVPVWPSQVEVIAGSFLVIELGQYNPNGNNTSRVDYVIGDGNATDLPEDSSTTSAFNPWIEFSQPIVLAG